MAHITADRVRDTSTSTGTGTIVVSGTAPASFRTFSDVLSTSDTFYYAIQHQTVSEWEVGLGTYSSANTITRTTVLASSAGGSAVSFSAGTKDVFITLAATRTLQQGAGGEVAVSANSSTNALRITQTGAGNALLVEDSANPDATPFVVDSGGKVFTGSATNPYSGSFSIFNSTGNVRSFRADAFSASTFSLAKSRSTTVGTPGVVSSGDQLGFLGFQGDDGTNFITAAQISSNVDGTPGTNDMPGRIAFLTTAAGASTPTERMRIDSAGRVGIGSVPTGGNTFTIGRTVTGATIAYSQINAGAVQSDVTSAAYYFSSFATTAAASFTLPALVHYVAQQSTIGAGSSVTNQYGFFVTSGLTGATNNFGFRGEIAAGTGRWNFYAGGTAPNYFAGNVSIGSTSSTYKLSVVGAGETAAPTVGGSKGANILVGTGAISANAGGAIEFGAGGTTSSFAAWKGGLTSGSNNTLGYLAAYTRQTDTDAAMAERLRITQNGNVGIGTSAPNASAALDVTSTTAGVLFPRMTTTQKNAISSPAAGLVVFDTTLSKLCVYSGVTWETITSV